MPKQISIVYLLFCLFLILYVCINSLIPCNNRLKNSYCVLRSAGCWWKEYQIRIPQRTSLSVIWEGLVLLLGMKFVYLEAVSASFYLNRNVFDINCGETEHAGQVTDNMPLAEWVIHYSSLSGCANSQSCLFCWRLQNLS